MTSYADTTKLPADQARTILRAAARARETAWQEIRARFAEARRADAAEEAVAARARIAEAGGIRNLSRQDYARELAAMQKRLRRSR